MRHPASGSAQLGGFLETKRIADMAAVFALPMSSHNTGSQVFTYSTCQWAASIRDYIACETITGKAAGWIRCWFSTPRTSRTAFVQVADKPGSASS
jgi:L-alanine-DL-glutamate epimerase-like enolase superfamily enzyme